MSQIMFENMINLLYLKGNKIQNSTQISIYNLTADLYEGNTISFNRNQ